MVEESVTPEIEEKKGSAPVFNPDTINQMLQYGADEARHMWNNGGLQGKAAIQAATSVYDEIETYRAVGADPKLLKEGAIFQIAKAIKDAAEANTRAETAEAEAVRVRYEAEKMRIELALANLRSQEADERLKMVIKMANEDVLTGTGNRRKFDEEFNLEYAKAQKEGAPLSLAEIDLDRMKYVNDTFSHLAGDLMIQEAVAIMREFTREHSYRFGGDELMMLLPNTTPQQAMVVANRVSQVASETLLPRVQERLRAMIADYERRKNEAKEKGEEIPVEEYNTAILEWDDRLTLSIGVGGMADEGLSQSEVKRRADIALYNAKYSDNQRQYGLAAEYVPGMQMPDKQIQTTSTK